MLTVGSHLILTPQKKKKNHISKIIFLLGKYDLGVLLLPKMAVFPDLLKWSPTLRRALWRCRNVGFPRPECRVTAPISAVWWPEEEATEILAWRKKKKKEGRRRWERQEGIFFLLWVGICVETEERLKRDSWHVYLGEHRLVSAPLCRCVSPLGGSKTGFGECRSSVA